MIKIRFTPLALCIALTAPSVFASSHTAPSFVEDQGSEKALSTPSPLPIDVLASDNPEAVIDIRNTQKDLSRFLEGKIAEAVKAHYPFLATQLETLSKLGIDPAPVCRFFLVKGYIDQGFLNKDLSSFTPIKKLFLLSSNIDSNSIFKVAKHSLEGITHANAADLSNHVRTTVLSFETYRTLCTYIDGQFDEFITMVIGTPLKAPEKQVIFFS